jgi:hypothetical protein
MDCPQCGNHSIKGGFMQGKQRFYTDCWAAFAKVLPSEKLTQSKKETHDIERHNCRNRHWVARFNRKTIAFSCWAVMVEATMKLFAYFRFSPAPVIETLLPNLQALLI